MRLERAGSESGEGQRLDRIFLEGFDTVVQINQRPPNTRQMCQCIVSCRQRPERSLFGSTERGRHRLGAAQEWWGIFGL